MLKKKTREILFIISLMGVVVSITLFSIYTIKLREDLSFLQIDFTDVLIEAKKCLAGGGKIQDPSLGDEGKVFICTKQNITKATYPVLKKISRQHLKYKYTSSQKCLKQKCNPQNPRINISRGWRLVMSCDIQKGRCEVK